MRRPGVTRAGSAPAWFDPLVAGYLGSLRRRNRSVRTIDTYRYLLANFGAFLRRVDVPHLADLRVGDIEQWQDELAATWSASSRQLATIAVKGVLKWCEREGLPLHGEHLHRRVDSISVPENDPRPIEPADLTVILRALRDPDRSEIRQLRDRALFLALFSSGSRVTAVLSLDRNSIKENAATIRQKGNKPMVLLFSNEAVSAIGHYLQARADDHPAMFVGHRTDIRGRALPARRFTLGAANRRWAKLAAELSIPRWKNHQIRHSTATELLRRKVDVVTISRHMGWRGLARITNYARVDLELRRQALAALGVG